MKLHSLQLLCLSLFIAISATYAFAAAEEGDVSRPAATEGPTKVRVSLYLGNVYDISGSDQTFVADMVLRAEWMDPRLAGRRSGIHSVELDDVWNPRLLLVNQHVVTPLLPQRVEIEPSGLVRYRQRWSGRFAARMDLKDFPLDRQQLFIQIVSLGYHPDEIEFVSKPEEMQWAKIFSTTDWSIESPVVEKSNFQAAHGVEPLAGIRLRWEVKRLVGYYAVQLILPLTLIVIMGWTALWLDASVVSTRVTVTMTTMLTLIAYRFSLARFVPNLNYLTRFDHFMLASTMLIFLVLLIVAMGAHLVAKGKTEVVHKIDKWGRMAFVALFAIVFVLSWWGWR